MRTTLAAHRRGVTDLRRQFFRASDVAQLFNARKGSVHLLCLDTTWPGRARHVRLSRIRWREEIFEGKTTTTGPRPIRVEFPCLWHMFGIALL